MNLAGGGRERVPCPPKTSPAHKPSTSQSGVSASAFGPSTTLVHRGDLSTGSQFPVTALSVDNTHRDICTSHTRIWGLSGRQCHPNETPLAGDRGKTFQLLSLL